MLDLGLLACQWNLDENGRRRFFQGRNREERDITHDEHHPELEVGRGGTCHSSGIERRALQGEESRRLWSGNPADSSSVWCLLLPVQVLLQNGEHAIPLNSENFNDYLKANEYTFANFVSADVSVRVGVRVGSGV